MDAAGTRVQALHLPGGPTSGRCFPAPSSRNGAAPRHIHLTPLSLFTDTLHAPGTPRTITHHFQRRPGTTSLKACKDSFTDIIHSGHSPTSFIEKGETPRWRETEGRTALSRSEWWVVHRIAQVDPHVVRLRFVLVEQFEVHPGSHTWGNVVSGRRCRANHTKVS